MKNIKIFTILLLLMGFGTVYSQQNAGALPEDLQKDKTGQQDRATLSPDPAPGELTFETEAMPVSAPPTVTDDSQSPDPSNPDLTGQSKITQPTTENKEDEGPNPNNPNGIRPDTN